MKNIIRRKADEEIEALEAGFSTLKSQVTTITKQRDQWESDARFIQGQLKESEDERHEVKDRLEQTEKQLEASQAEKAKLLEEIEQKDQEVERQKTELKGRNQELERKDKLLVGEYEVRMENIKKMKAMETELVNLRKMKAAIRGLVADEGNGDVQEALVDNQG